LLGRDLAAPLLPFADTLERAAGTLGVVDAAVLMPGAATCRRCWRS
jgi:hypothetical protein